MSAKVEENPFIKNLEKEVCIINPVVSNRREVQRKAEWEDLLGSDPRK
jgi:hypothetical protein